MLLELRPDWTQYLQRGGIMLFRIDKALYVLMEAARLWFLHLVALLTAHDFKQSQADKAVLLLRRTGSKRLYVCLHVDDTTTCSSVCMMFACIMCHSYVYL